MESSSRGTCDARRPKVYSALLVLGGVVVTLSLAVAAVTASWERDAMRAELAELAREVASFQSERENLHSKILHITTEISSVRADLAQQEGFMRTALIQSQDRGSSAIATASRAITASAGSMSEFVGESPSPLLPGHSEIQPPASQIADSHARRLEIIGSVYLSGSAVVHSGCVQYTETGTRTIDMANPTPTCNGNKCPTCFVLNPASALALTITNCGQAYVTNTLQLGEANTDRESSLVKFIFVNRQSTNTLTDGGGSTVTLTAGQTYKAWCMSTGLNTGVSGTAHKFYWEKDPS